METKAGAENREQKAEREQKAKSIMEHKCFDCINAIWCRTRWRAACRETRVSQDIVECSCLLFTT